jgi:hypothetical protein
MRPNKYVSGRYERFSDVLHLWFPERVVLDSSAKLEEFFAEVTENWINTLPTKVYLLVNFQNLEIAASQTTAYRDAIAAFGPRLLGTVRYGMRDGSTQTVVRCGNIALEASSNIYPDEKAAREAIAKLKALPRAS